MTDITFAIEAKSDQLNAVDIIGCDRIIHITAVNVNQADQPVHVRFQGDNNRPWKPSKGMLRILVGCWGSYTANWVGKSAQLYFEPTVMYAGKEVGGIRVRAVSDIQAPKTFSIAINRSKRDQVQVGVLQVRANQYPNEQFNAALPTMIKKMQSGKMTLQQIIAKCEQTGRLSHEQLSALEQNAPKDDQNA